MAKYLVTVASEEYTTFEIEYDGDEPDVYAWNPAAVDLRVLAWAKLANGDKPVATDSETIDYLEIEEVEEV